MAKSEHDLGFLLDLDGFIAEVGGGYWVKINAKRIKATAEKPHGIDYTLSLHQPNGERVLGYDNAHPVSQRQGPSRKISLSNDHRHHFETVRRYEYSSASKLVEDFWRDVDRILIEQGVSK